MPKPRWQDKLTYKVVEIPNNFTPEQQEEYARRAARAIWKAIDELEAKGLMKEVS